MNKKQHVGSRTSGPTAQHTDRGRVEFLRRQLWQAEFIRWPALAESFRRELRKFGVEA